MKINNSFRLRRTTTLLLALSIATLLATAAAVRAESPSDTLEQGIYSEETKGDLEAAMQLYQKVIVQAKADQTSAAQAQYHLGVCYYKKENFSDANAAFESVFKDYPDQTNIVALARKYLSGAKALLRRGGAAGAEYRFGRCRLDLTAHKLHRGEEEVPLTAKEFRLLEFFIRRVGRALTRDSILDAVWGQEVMVTDRSVDRCVTTLRAKIEDDPHNPAFIQTIRDIGYRFEAPP